MRRRNNFQIERAAGKLLNDEFDRIYQFFEDSVEFQNLTVKNTLKTKHLQFSGRLLGTDPNQDHELKGRLIIRRYQGQTLDLIRVASEADATLFAVDKDGDITGASATLSSSLTVTGTVLIQTGGASANVIGSMGAAGSIAFARSSDGSVQGSVGYLGASESGNIRLNSGGGGGIITFGTGASEKMRLHNSGGLSLGNTTDPGATNLSVTGNAAVGGATVSSSTGLITPVGTTALSSLRIPHGAAPTSPVNGDIWTTTAGLYVRINGSTVGPLS